MSNKLNIFVEPDFYVKNIFNDKSYENSICYVLKNLNKKINNLNFNDSNHIYILNYELCLLLNNITNFMTTLKYTKISLIKNMNFITRELNDKELIQYIENNF